MRCVLFYSEVESFNYFTDQLVAEITAKGHETFILDLRSNCISDEHSFSALSEFVSTPADIIITFDGKGIQDQNLIDIWDKLGLFAVNILMDPPFRFHITMCNHPANYLQLCCDMHHVDYTKALFHDHVQYVDFMPHAGTYNGPLDLSDYATKPYDVLFSGTYYEPDSYFNQVNTNVQGNALLKEFYYNLANYVKEHRHLSTDEAALEMMKIMQLDINNEQVKLLLALSEPIDWMVRMYFRGEVIRIIAESGINIALLGRGWENHPSVKAGLPNVTVLSDRVPFAESLEYMSKAKINLNVMPWFKDGTHDRIFNILLRGSLPFTDDSIWLRENFADDESIAYFSLDDLNAIPAQIKHYLDNPSECKRIIQNGYEIVKNNFTFEQITDQILSYFE